MEYTVRVFRVLFAIANEMGVNHGIHEAHEKERATTCQVSGRLAVGAVIL